MKEAFIEKIYAGWLAKIIGIRLGAPVEGWTYEKIKNIYGELTDYPVDYREFAADDDSNGPLFFLRALEDSKHGYELCAQDVAEALLNYAPFEHGFFWWGGYGISTEHTAYLNLQNGIPAPRSGSIEQNGSTVAEQIGGQIFIDTWGLVAPGNPELAAKYAAEAASVTHGGNGIYGGIFVAVCISYAFIESDIRKILEKALSFIPQDCAYARVVKAVTDFYVQHRQEGWRSCFAYIHEHYGYDKYPGNCHIIPNAAVMILALLYGEGDFSDTLTICNMCGWDTDCNVGNVATIMGVRNGLQGIDDIKWREPVHDFLACSSVVGSLNIMDIPFGALYIAKLAYAVAGETMPMPWRKLAEERIDSCHFEYPGSTHAMRIYVDKMGGDCRGTREYRLQNTEETAFTGKRSLKFLAKPVEPGENVYVYKKTYYRPEEFHDSRYDPGFSPLVYPGQTIHGSAFLPEYGESASVCLYVREGNTGKRYFGEKVSLRKGQWCELHFTVPKICGGLIEEMGFCFHVQGIHTQVFDFTGLIDDLYATGNPSYTIDFAKEREEIWTGLHREISQFTRLKGLSYLTGESLHLSCADFGEVYTGRHDWEDYAAVFLVMPVTGNYHLVNVRVQGASRSYAAGLLPNGAFGILKKENGYKVLKSTNFSWEPGKEYRIGVKVRGNTIEAELVKEKVKIEVTDENSPYRKGGIGLSCMEGSHMQCRGIEISADYI